MTALIAVADYSSKSEPECYVRRLVVVDGDLCSPDCPHIVPMQGCNGFHSAGMRPAPEGRAYRCDECKQSTFPSTERRAERAIRLLQLLRSRKRVRHSVPNEAEFLERIRARQRKRGGLTFDAIYALSGRPSKRIPWWQFEIYVLDLVRLGVLRVSSGHFFVDDNLHLESAVMIARKNKQELPDHRQLKIAGVE